MVGAGVGGGVTGAGVAGGGVGLPKQSLFVEQLVPSDDIVNPDPRSIGISLAQTLSASPKSIEFGVNVTPSEHLT